MLKMPGSWSRSSVSAISALSLREAAGGVVPDRVSCVVTALVSSRPLGVGQVQRTVPLGSSEI
jgi:hypothetical protein